LCEVMAFGKSLSAADPGGCEGNACGVPVYPRGKRAGDAEILEGQRWVHGLAVSDQCSAPSTAIAWRVKLTSDKAAYRK
jgi:hypothetical protein